MKIDVVPGLDRAASAEFLSPLLGRELKPGSLARLASQGAGPEYELRFGKAIYRVDRLLAWVVEVTKKPRARRQKKVVPFTPRPTPDSPSAA